MIYLLDVNALLALGYTAHVHNLRVSAWLALERERSAPGAVKLATCATTELGFIRVACGPARLAPTLREARLDLAMLNLRERMLFIGDRVVGTDLPEWVSKGGQTTDGHLLNLAKASGARLATLDRDIRGAELIPDFVDAPCASLDLANHCRCSA